MRREKGREDGRRGEDIKKNREEETDLKAGGRQEGEGTQKRNRKRTGMHERCTEREANRDRRCSVRGIG